MNYLSFYCDIYQIGFKVTSLELAAKNYIYKIKKQIIIFIIVFYLFKLLALWKKMKQIICFIGNVNEYNAR